MADIEKVKRNIQRMIDQNAPESDIDAYVASEGTTPEQLRSQKSAAVGRPNTWGMSSEAMDFVTGGLQSKLGAAASGLVDATGNYMGGGDFNYSDSYNRALEQSRADQKAYQEQNPVKSYIGTGIGLALGVGALPAFGTGIKGAIKTGAGYGAISGAGQDAESLSDRAYNTAVGGGLGGVLGGGIGFAAKGIGKAMQPIKRDPQRYDLAKVLEQEGVGLTAGQATGDDMLRYAESELGGRTTADILDNQRGQFTAAALRKIGVNSRRATPEVIKAAYKTIGNSFDDMASKYDVVADTKIADDLYKTVGEYQDLTSQADQVDYVFNVGNRIYNTFSQSGKMTGAEYKSLRSEISRKARETTKPETKGALIDLMDILDDAMERNIARVAPEDLGKWKKIRGSYRNFLVLEKASGGAGENAALGFISPQSLQIATKQKHGNRAYVQGDSDFADLARAGVGVLREMPQSGTAPRTAARAMWQSIPTLMGTMIGAPAGLPGMLAGGLFGAASPQIMGKALMSRPVQNYLKRGGSKSAKKIGPAANRLVPSLAVYGGNVTSGPR